MGAKQGTTTVLPGQNYGNGSGAKGSSNTSRLNAAYASSPVTKQEGNLADDGSLTSDMRAWYQANVLDGQQDGNTLMGGVNMDYGTAPDLADGTYGGGAGEAANPYVPNVASPGEGNGANPTNIPAADAVGGHDGDLGAVQGPKNSSIQQSKFNLTNMPNPGKGPGVA